jgi:predicted Rossmann fold flavoprotein
MAEHLKDFQSSHPQQRVGKFFPALDLTASSDDEWWEQELQAQKQEERKRERESEEAKASSSSAELPAERGAIPRRLWLYLLQRAGVDPSVRWSRLSDTDLDKAANEVSRGVFRVTGRGVYRDEFVTAGGVSLKEVDFKTMQSRCVTGLFMAGECLDVDGVTGGFNFQSAWTTATLAGRAAAEQLQREARVRGTEGH